MKTHWKKPSGWQDAVELVVVIWIFVSPVVLGFFAYNAETLTAMMVAAVASLTTQLRIAKQQPWEEWFNLTLAVFLVLSPWIFGYTAAVAATWNAVLAGLLLAIFATLALFDEYAHLRNVDQGQTHGPAR